jgi:hypothetical protein
MLCVLGLSAGAVLVKCSIDYPGPVGKLVFADHYGYE